MKQSVLITGGLGYVGGRVAEYLAKHPAYEIFVTSRNPKTACLPAWCTADHCLPLDLENDDDIRSVCKNMDVVIHFAALNEIDSAKDPDRALLVNGLGTQKLMRSAITANVNRFIYFSTAHIYGAPLEGTITEDTLPRPVHPYAITHRYAEDSVLAASREGKIRGIVIRLSNSLGTPINGRVDRWSLISNDLCRQAMTKHELQLKSAGLQVRDFIALSDVARAVAHVVALDEEKLGNGIFNLGGEQAISILDLAARIQDRCTKKFHFTPPITRPDPLPGEKGGQLTYSIGKLKATGFHLAGNLDDEIDGTLAFCKNEFCTR
ncbi:MAG TPA: SDR family oxidoreductase [Methanoregula sp.]|nr:SDR family oxidoreductase [Methanoregula sp.]